MKSLFRNFFGAHCLAVCCAFALNGNVEAQTFDDYKGKTVVLAAQKDGVAYAMDGSATATTYPKLQIKITKENEVVYLTTTKSQKNILWEIGGTSGSVDITSVYDNKKLYINSSGKLAKANSVPASGTAFKYNNDYYSFTYASTKPKATFGLIMEPSSFKLDYVSYITNPSHLYPIAKPYFLAEHTWRTLGSSNFGTICFPKAVRADEVAGATFYEIAAKIMDNGEFKGVVLNEVTGDLAAGTPYIFKRASDATYIVAAMHGDAAVATSHNGLGGTLTGSEEDGSFEVPAGMYILQGDQLWLTTTGQSRLLVGRAYINPDGIKEVTSANASHVKGIVLGTDAPADGIRTTKVTKGAQGVAFDLQGRPATRPQHGHTYLINGHKVYIK